MRPRRALTLPGQESVWDFPRPAIAQATTAHVRITHSGVVVADTRAAVRTLETSHPPSYYVPQSGIPIGRVRIAGGGSFCEWKGQAVYWDVVIDGLVMPRVGTVKPN